MKTKKITTPCGAIKGIDFGDYLEFRGIKYATSKRWEYSEEVTAWDGVYDATEFGDCPCQRRAFEEDAVCNAFYHKEFREGMTFTYSEDCLFLNIYAPKKVMGAPILFYIHGGSFTGGSANEGHISGVEYAKNGVIFVSINYRLGPYGFCSHPDLRNEDGVCGNFGLYDQFNAIKWVRHNIEAFGGDPNKLTLLGQSAGAMSVDIQLSNPEAEGWYAGAILMSGAALQRDVVKPVKPETTKEFWDTIIKNANVNNIEELREIDEKKLYYAWYDACQANIMSMVYTLPVVDGKMVTKETFNMSTIPDIPYVIGVTVTDMFPSILKSITKSWVRKTKSHKNKTFVYDFARELPGDDKGAWHACDLLYAFATLNNNWRPFQEVDYEISNQMVKSFVAFCKKGDPNCNALPWWRAGANKVMNFSEKTEFSAWPDAKLIKNTLFNWGSI